jgi:hypothetical protein
LAFSAVVLHGAGSNSAHYNSPAALPNATGAPPAGRMRQQRPAGVEGHRASAYDRHVVDIVLEVLPLGGVHPLPTPGPFTLRGVS